MGRRLEGLVPQVGMKVVSFWYVRGLARHGKSDMDTVSFWRPRVENTNWTTIASEDGRAWVTLGREYARLQLNARLITNVSLQSDIASHNKVSGVTVLRDIRQGSLLLS